MSTDQPAETVMVTAALWWMGFAPGTSEASARYHFERRYGVQPSRVIEGRNIVLAGPVPEAKEDADAL
jgi:hypothetical protein